MGTDETWTAVGDEIVLRLSVDDYDRLLIMMGFATGAAFKKDVHMAYQFVDLVNRINRGNPKFRPYAIPKEFQEKGTSQ